MGQLRRPVSSEPQLCSHYLDSHALLAIWLLGLRVDLFLCSPGIRAPRECCWTVVLSQGQPLSYGS